MGCKLDFEWLSDPLLQYALYLGGIFFIGILVCMILIAHKFQSHHSHQMRQAHAIGLIRTLLNAGQDNQSHINALNQSIQAHPIDSCYAFVRVLEDSLHPIDLHQFESIQIRRAIDLSLRSFFRKNHAIAIEAIGLLRYDNYCTTITRYLDDPECCSFAAEALIRLKGIAAVPTILDCYHRQLLTISQTLTALAQLAPIDLRGLLLRNTSIALPAEFLRYLRAP